MNSDASELQASRSSPWQTVKRVRPISRLPAMELASVAETNQLQLADPVTNRVMTDRDLLQQIFSFMDVQRLCVVSTVCRLWRTLSQSDNFWERVEIHQRQVSKEQVAILCERHPCIKTLSIVGALMGTLDDSFFTRIVHHWRNLQSLTVGREMVRDNCLSLLTATALPSLRTLTFQDVSISFGLPIEAELAHAFLESFEFESCRVGRLALRCPKLSRLSLRGSQISGLAVTLPELVQLDMSGCSKLSDVSIRTTLSLLPSLTALDLRNVLCISDETLLELAHHLTALESLDVSGCTLVTLGGLRGFGGLRQLNLSDCGSAAESGAALQSCSRLEVLRMDNCNMLKELSLSSPSLTCLSLRGCRALQSLHLSCWALNELLLSPNEPGSFAPCGALREVRLTSGAITSLTWRGFPSLETVDLDCPMLRELVFADCDQLRSAVLDSLSDTALLTTSTAPLPTTVPRQGGCPRLHTLRLECCEGLNTLTLRHSALRVLVLSGCKLSTVKVSCPSLGALRLEECEGLEGVTLDPVGVEELSLGSCACLAALELNAPELSALDLRGCGRLSELSLACPKLYHLDISFCSSLTDETLKRAAEGGPPLRHLVLSVCCQLGPSGLTTLSCLTQLMLLDLSYTNVDDLCPVYAACPALRSLSVASCSQLHHSCLETLLPSPSQPPALPHLKELDVSYTYLPANTINALLCLGSRLESLALSGCNGVTDETWRSLSHPPAAVEYESHSLTSLTLVKCRQLRTLCLGLTPSSPITILTNKPYLPPERTRPPANEIFDWVLAPGNLKGLKSLRLGLSGVQVLALALPHLTLLDASGCTQLRHLELRCPVLLTAYLQSCRALTSPVLISALDRCSRLETLDILHSGAGQEGPSQLHTRYPYIRSLLACPADCNCCPPANL